METHWLAEDDECGVFAAGPKSLVLTMLADHFISHHPGINPIINGEHYRLYEAPIRCDVCSTPTEPPFWTHVTPEPIDTKYSVDVDQEWLLCQECHGIVNQRDALRLAIRMIKMLELRSPGLVKGREGVNVRVQLTELARTYVQRLDTGRLDAH